jgi:hypothetical protein
LDEIDQLDRSHVEENDAEEDCYAISEENALEVIVQGNMGADCQRESAEAISEGEYCPWQSLS